MEAAKAATAAEARGWREVKTMRASASRDESNFVWGEETGRFWT